MKSNFCDLCIYSLRLASIQQYLIIYFEKVRDNIVVSAFLPFLGNCMIDFHPWQIGIFFIRSQLVKVSSCLTKKKKNTTIITNLLSAYFETSSLVCTYVRFFKSGHFRWFYMDRFWKCFKSIEGFVLKWFIRVCSILDRDLGSIRGE